jgi:hypothetical protein
MLNSLAALSAVMAGLVPATYVFVHSPPKMWMPGTSSEARFALAGHDEH